MLEIPKIINNGHSVDDVIINYFGISLEKISNIIDKQKQRKTSASASMKKYYDKMKDNDEFIAKVLESKKKYYYNNKDKLRQYYIDRLNDDEIKERYMEKKRQHYKENKTEILERQRIAYHEKNKDKPKLKVGRKPKIKIQNETTTSDNIL